MNFVLFIKQYAVKKNLFFFYSGIEIKARYQMPLNFNGLEEDREKNGR